MDEPTFEECVELTADEFGVASFERPALLTDPVSGDLKLYVSTDHDDGDWAIQKLADTPSPGEFDPDSARTVLAPRPDATDVTAVKDSYVLTVGRRY